MKNIFLIVLPDGLHHLPAKKITSPAPAAEKKFYRWDEFNMGVDLSYVNQIEDYGGTYSDSGKVKDCFKILKDHGANTVRVRLWHTPTWIGNLNNGKMYYDLYGVEKTIRRAKEAGMAVSLDIHYSDRWADPGAQETPAAWAGLPLNILERFCLQLHIGCFKLL